MPGIQCRKCGCYWDYDYISVLELHGEGINRRNSEEIKICQDCRSKVWAEYFA